MKTLRLNTLPRTIILILVLVATTVLSLSHVATGAASNTSFGYSLLPALVNASSPFAAAGDLDSSFDGDGKVTTDINLGDHGGRPDEARAVAIQPDGKIVVAGSLFWQGTTSSGWCYTLARYMPDGSLDVSFGDRGVITGGLAVCSALGGIEFNAVAIQYDGKIVAVGTTGHNNRSEHIFTVYRLNTNGSFDTTFGVRGYAVDVEFAGGPEESVAKGVAIAASGNIVVAGYTTQGSVTNFALAELYGNGDLYTYFDGDGKLTTDFFGSSDEARAVAIQSDGKIVASGYTHVGGGNYDFALARYNSNGSLDSTFSGDGKVNTDFQGGDDGAYAMAIQPDGKIVAAGGVHTISTGYDFGVARYLSNGSLDTGFSGGGFAAINFVSGTGTEVANGVAIQSNGNIVLAGYSPGVGQDFALARLLPNGPLDTSFSGDGRLTTDFSGGDDMALGVARQADGKIVAVGSAYMGSNNQNDFAIARYLPIPSDFGISVTPSTRTVLPGGSTTYSVSLTSISSFSGNVTLSVGTLPGQTSGSFNPQTVFIPSGGTGTATLTVATTIGSPQGTFTLSITATGGGFTHSQNVTLIIQTSVCC